ncbi:Beta-barrel assembly-enhancing protease [bacterium HR40]|nr:Beta-barrel assembly-enhancing protease [bacterium HR40]
MLKLLLFLLLAAVLAHGASWLADHPGLVVVEWLNWRIETSVGILVAASLLLVALAILLFEMLRWLVGWPRRMRERRQVDRVLRGYRALTHGLVAAAAGDPAAARLFAKQATRLLAGHEPGLHLLAAQRAQLEGEEETALREFRAMLREPETELLGLRGLLAYAVKAGNLEEALDLARRAYRRNPTTPWVLVTFFDLLTRQGAWQEALGVLNQLADLRLVDAAAARRRRAILHAMMAEEAERANRVAEAATLLRRAFKLAPDFAPVAVRYARLAAATNRSRLARRVLERSWKREPHPDVARAYMELWPARSPLERVRAASRLRTLKPFDPLAYVVLAETEMMAGAWDAARHALQRAEQLQPTARVFRVRAELERLAGAPREVVESWLQKALEAPADRAWVCEDTGEVVAEWQPFGVSGRFDAVQWTVPPKVARLAPGETPASFVVHVPGPASREIVPVREAAPPAADGAAVPASKRDDHRAAPQASSSESESDEERIARLARSAA